jgi:hypothetical protein
MVCVCVCVCSMELRALCALANPQPTPLALPHPSPSNGRSETDPPQWQVHGSLSCSRAGMAGQLFRWYAGCMSTRPLLTNVCTAVPLMVCGDTLAQRIEGGGSDGPPRRSDLERTLTMACYSGLIFTPAFFSMYRWMDRSAVFRHPWIASKVRGAVARSLFSVGIGGLPVNAAFLTLATAIEMKVFRKKARDGESLSTVVVGKLETDLPRIMLGSITFW